MKHNTQPSCQQHWHLGGGGWDHTPQATTPAVVVVAVGALVHGRVPATWGATVGAGALAPWVACRLVGLLAAGHIPVLDSNHTQLGVSQLLKGPQGQVEVVHVTEDTTAAGGQRQGRVSTVYVVAKHTVHAELCRRAICHCDDTPTHCCRH